MSMNINGVEYPQVILVDPASGLPYAASSGAAQPAADRELVVSTYRCKTAFTGASVGDTITATQVIDVSGTPTTVSTVWRNQTTAADLAGAPSAANLELTGSTALTDAQLRASAVPVTDVAIGAANDAAATTDTGTFSLLALFKRSLQRLTSILSTQTISVDTVQYIAVGTFSTQSIAVAAGTNRVVLSATTDCWIQIGTNPTANKAAGSFFLPAGGQSYPISVTGGITKIAVLQDSAAGFLSVIESA